ncbi:hypothetical protein [Ureibacillus acetophenoni]|uniref:Uncharacterized protein n=1 Tax=Ureibacillus acetophenoni TaxID=614649 RepID=A0A285UTD5_9BACL|nr:hypothetical protein [Ureibacillus acetophenoni]SOC45063.1 hypothetical protein SAMN05877842_1301 [Ureibacillus acetophenoni]
MLIVAGDRYDEYKYDDKVDLLDHLDKLKDYYLDEYFSLEDDFKSENNTEEFEKLINSI